MLLGCLVMRRPATDYPEVNFSLKDCSVPASIISSCLRGVQSYVRNPEFKLGVFFSQHTLGCARDSISGAREFMSSSSFDPWNRLCVGDRAEFIQRYSELFKTHIDRRKEESYQRFRVAIVVLLMSMYSRRHLVVVGQVGAHLQLRVLLRRRLLSGLVHSHQKMVVVVRRQSTLQRKHQKNSRVAPLVPRNDEPLL